MAQIISVSIDLTKIDKSKIVSKDANGQPFKNGALYLNLQISVNDEKDQYGNDASVSINQTKEERDAKAPRTYLGNGKIVWQSTPIAHQAVPMNGSGSSNEEEHDHLPF